MEFSTESTLTISTLRVDQQQLLRWFRLNAPSIADPYEGAVRLVNDKSFPGRVHFIAHAVRDIADRLVFVLDDDLDEHRVQYENKLDEIMKKWPNLDNVANNDKEGTLHDSVTIERELAIKIDSLIKDHRERRERPSNYELLFRYLMKNEPLQTIVNSRILNDFTDIRKWFMALAHLRKDKPNVDEHVLEMKFKNFEVILHSFVGDFFTGISEIDEILQQANQ